MIALNTTEDEVKHQNNLEKYKERIKELIEDVIKSYISLYIALRLTSKERFAFSLFPKAKNRVNEIRETAREDIYNLIYSGVKSEWRTDKGIREFLNREIKGLTLNDRIDNLVDNIELEAEAIINAGLKDSNNLELLDKRLKDKFGSDYKRPPSSVNIGTTLIFSETHTAFRISLLMEWAKNDNIVGYEVRRTHNETDCAVCDSLTGFYPKSYIFIGWHIRCMCYPVPVYHRDFKINPKGKKWAKENSSVINGLRGLLS